MTATYKYVTQSTLELSLLEARSYRGRNANAYQFPRYRVGAWKPDGTVTLADSTNPLYQKIVGVSYEVIPSGSSGLFIRGGVVENALVGLNASAGDEIFLSAAAGTLTNVKPTEDGQTVIRIGFAEAGSTSGADNLRMDVDATGSAALGDVNAAIAASNSQSYRNGTVSSIQPFKAVSWSGQTVVPGDASSADTSRIIGITFSVIPPGAFGLVQHSGVIPDAVASLQAAPGSPVFLSDTGNGSLTLTPPNDLLKAVIRIGYAVPKTGTSNAATDLLLAIERLLIP